MPRDPAPLVVRVPIFAVGGTLVGLGVALMVRSDLGVSPTDVLTTGLADHLGLGVGFWSWCVATVLAFIAWRMGRTPRIGTLIGAVVVGGVVAAGLRVIDEPSALGLRAALLAAGLLVLYTGIVAIVTSSMGTGPLELVMLALGDRGWRLEVARWVLEVAIVLAGVLLGGQLGIGTVLFAVCTGPVLAAVLPHTMRWMGTDAVLPPVPTRVSRQGVTDRARSRRAP